MVALSLIIALYFFGKMSEPRIPRVKLVTKEESEKLNTPMVVESEKPEPLAVVPEIESKTSEPLAVEAKPAEYYTTKRVTETTDAGVKGIADGVKVTILETKGDYLLVSDGKVQVLAYKHFITSDPNEIKNILAKNESKMSETLAIMRSGVNPADAPAPPALPQGASQISTNPILPIITENTTNSITTQNTINTITAINSVKARITITEDKIRETEAKDAVARRGGRISGHGPTITRYNIELTKLREQLRILESSLK